MIDMGLHKGQRIWYTEGKSLAELIEEGTIIAVPTSTGMIFKRAEIITEIEHRGAYTIDEVRAFAEKYGANDNDDEEV